MLPFLSETPLPTTHPHLPHTPLASRISLQRLVCWTLKRLDCAGGTGEDGKLTKIWKRSGTGRIDLDVAGAGDIVSVTGLASARIADTVGALSLEAALEPGEIEPPTLRYTQAGRSGGIDSCTKPRLECCTN